MDYQQSLEYVHSLERFGSVLGLARIEKLLAFADNPHKNGKFIHIAGTNGKGSTATLTSRVLTESGYKTGLFTSPFVVNFRERFMIDGKMISEQEFANIASKLRPYVDKMAANGEQITEFEFITAVSFCYFSDNSCDFVCLEVGLGGEFDATNVIDTPLLSVITAISLDHTNILGDTYELVAKAKAGIIKPNGTTVCYPEQDEAVLGVIMERCATMNNQLIMPNIGAVSVSFETSHDFPFLQISFSYDDNTYELSLIGQHQVYNAVTVLSVIAELKKRGYSIPTEKIQQAFKSTYLPARFELFSENPTVIVDGAHNEQGALALTRILSKTSRKEVAVIAMMSDKDYRFAIKIIAACCDAVVATKALNPRSLSAEEIAKVAKTVCDDVTVSQSVTSALEKAKEIAGKDGVVVVCGSLFLAGEVLNSK